MFDPYSNLVTGPVFGGQVSSVDSNLTSGTINGGRSMGIDALNPIQVSAEDMDTVELRKTCGNRVSFWRAISTHILAFGDSRDVRKEVRKRLEDLAEGGGYVLSAVHNIQPIVPPQNICAMFEAALE